MTKTGKKRKKQLHITTAKKLKNLFGTISYKSAYISKKTMCLHQIVIVLLKSSALEFKSKF